jgi:hypothetical protein
MNIAQAPSGINLVVELSDTVYIGRMGRVDGTRVRLRHAAVYQAAAGENPESFIRRTAKYGVPVEHEDLEFEAKDIQRVRKLGDVPKT